MLAKYLFSLNIHTEYENLDMLYANCNHAPYI